MSQLKYNKLIDKKTKKIIIIKKNSYKNEEKCQIIICILNLIFANHINN